MQRTFFGHAAVLVSGFLLQLLYCADGQVLYGYSVPCVGPNPITTLPNCEFWSSKVDECGRMITTDPKEFVACYCPQTVLDALVLYVQVFGLVYQLGIYVDEYNIRCQGEFKKCNADDSFDASFTGPEGLISSWSTVCDGVLTYTPTMISLSQPTATYNSEACLSAMSQCASASVSSQRCTDSHTAFSDITSCWCQPGILSMASRCEIDGSSSCLRMTTLATTTFWSYIHCRRFENQSIGTTRGTAIVQGTKSMSASTTTLPGLTTSGPASLFSTLGLPTITSTPTSSGARVIFLCSAYHCLVFEFGITLFSYALLNFEQLQLFDIG
jgi:hypothetical protein